MEQEREQGKAEMAQAELVFRHERKEHAMNLRRKELQEETQLKYQCTLKIQNAFRLFSARSELKRRIKLVVAKEYDPTTRSPTYRNTRTNTRTTKKPVHLGQDDLDYVDKWYLMTDDASGVYYYNPFQLQQSWSLPSADQCLVCGACAATFASVYCVSHDCAYCQDCYQQQYLEDNSVSVDARPVDGALHNAPVILERIRQSLMYQEYDNMVQT